MISDVSSKRIRIDSPMHPADITVIWDNGVCSFPPFNRPINFGSVYWGFRDLSINYQWI